MINYQNYNARKTGEYGKIWTNTGKCVFCDLKDKYIIKKGEYSVLTVNIFPYIDGHLLVVPLRHVETFQDINSNEWLEMQKMSDLGIRLLKSELKIEEIWLLFRVPKRFGAGKTVPHAHMLLMPYKKELVSWHYQHITISPLNLAQNLRHKINGEFVV